MFQQCLRRQKMYSTPVSQPPTPNTPAGSISTITVEIPPRVLAEDLTKATLREGSPNLLQMALKCVCKQTTSELTDSHSAGEQGGTKDNLASSSKQRVLTAHSSAPGLTGVTFYQQRSLHFEELTTMSQVMSGLAILVHLPGISLWIIKDTWPQNSTQV